ncbi:predicted transcriptional regulator [Clostridium sp. CAG:575]|nr:predicted transcriptional regulator [Clostridium sp. CAG:575]
MAIDYNVIGSRIKQARLAKNMTQEDLADKIDVSVAFLSRVERGNSHINLKRLNQLCGLLDVSEGYLLNGASSSSENYLDKEFSDLFKNVSPAKQRLIYDIAKTIADSNLDEE